MALTSMFGRIQLEAVKATDIDESEEAFMLSSLAKNKEIESMRAELTELRQLLMAKNSGSLSAIWDALATPSAPPVRGVSDDIDILRTQLYTEHLRLRQTIAATTSSVETLQRELKSVCLNKRCGLSVCFPFRPTSYVALLNVCASSMLESIQCSDSPSSSSSEDGDRWKAKSVPAPSRPIYGLL